MADTVSVTQAAIDLVVDLCGAGASRSATNLRVVEDHLKQFARLHAAPNDDLRAVLEGFVAALTNNGKNEASCLTFNHDALRKLIDRAAALLARK